MSKLYRALPCAFLLLTAAGLLCAQQPMQRSAEQITGRPDLQATTGDRAKALPLFEVLPDGRVTFRLRAPQASTVVVRGDWPGGLGGRSTTAMSKDEQGLWSVTVGPLVPDTYSFTIGVDDVFGVPVFGNPASPTGNVIPLADGKFVVPGPYGSDFAPQDVPHGALSTAFAPFMGMSRVVYIYTPPSYYADQTKRYPVLILSGYAEAWLRETNVNVLMDNLIASGKAKPMIVLVMDPSGPGGNTNGWTPYAGGGVVTTPVFTKAAQAIADEIVPWLDKNFRTVADRDHRAIAGFSSPGSLGFLTGAMNPGKFASIGAFSGGFPTWPGIGVQVPTPEGIDTKKFVGPDMNRRPDMEKLGAMIPNLNANAKMRLVYMTAGQNEPLIFTLQLMKKFMDERGVKYETLEQPGYTHEWRYVRVGLHEFASKIFQW